MDKNDYSRREFLKKFAALSSASLLLGLGGCGRDNSSRNGWAAYGPPPVTGPSVSSIYFIDANANRVLLNTNQSVPIDTRFVITFLSAMDTTAPVTMTLESSGGNLVTLNPPVWEDAATLGVMPSAVLLNSTWYTLNVTDATDSTGRKLVVDANATAVFKTIAA